MAVTLVTSGVTPRLEYTATYSRLLASTVEKILVKLSLVLMTTLVKTKSWKK